MTDNELLTRVGKGTPMGELMRQYWMPALQSHELADADGDPMRLRLLGENLIAWRDTSGRVGMFANACPHRGASLFFARNEDNGLRCVYHGWKFDVTGACVDTPSEPPESNFKTKVRARSYPCVEQAGMIWVYMGPRETPPPLPSLEWMGLSDAQWSVTPFLRECNWVQALEGDIDTSHLYFLHGRLNPDDPPNFGVYHDDKHPHLEVVHTDYGIVYGASRDEDEATTYWRITQFAFPIHSLFPANADGSVPGHMWVPLDDENTLVWTMIWNPSLAIAETSLASQAIARGDRAHLPNTTDWLGRWRMQANKRNDYEIDRDLQRTKTFTGIPTIPMQDQAVTESMGETTDRTHEHLGTSDSMLIQVRRRLIRAAEALRDHGTIPPGVDNPEWYTIRSASGTLPKGESWFEGFGDWLNARSNTVPEVNLRVPER
jgi:phenylpropionate dioxygenase-like ring-hydroxylating dioxygenase large terminal subunit